MNRSKKFEESSEDLVDLDPTEEGKEKLNSLVSNLSTLLQVDEKKKTSKRNEPSTVFGELGLSASKKDKVELHHLLNSVVDKSGKIKRQVRKITHKKLLPLPLNSSQAKQIERGVNYEETVKDVSKWEPVVLKNREAPQLTFPLEKARVNAETAQEKFNLKVSNPLKAEVDALLSSSTHVVKRDKVLTEAEEKYLNQMNIEEARVRHAQLQKMRALISFREAKLKRKAKIKSKKYHRMLKKEKLKNELKEFEELKKRNPDAALEKLTQLDKMRALERASLKHLNSGKWAKQNLLRAKYDAKTREDIKEQMHLNKTLLQKAVVNEEDEKEDHIDESNDEDFEEGEVMMESDAFDDGKAEPNPWLMRSVSESRTPLLHSSDILNENADEEEKAKDCEKGVGRVVSTKKTQKNQSASTEIEERNKLVSDQESDDEEEGEKTKSSDHLMIDPKKILDAKKRDVETSVPDYQELGTDVESESEDDERRILLAEAFDGDDVIADFVKDKKEQIDKEEEKDVNNFLPGWGSWVGPGIKVNSRKKKKFVQKSAQKRRKDAQLHNVIISEKKDDAIAKFLVKELPFNCKSVQAFEGKYKSPIGPNWNPETQFRFNVEPKVITQMGKIIDPINEKALVKKPGNKRRPLDQIAKTLADVIPV